MDKGMSKAVRRPKKGLRGVCMCVCTSGFFFYSQMGTNYVLSNDASDNSGWLYKKKPGIKAMWVLILLLSITNPWSGHLIPLNLNLFMIHNPQSLQTTIR